MPTVEQFTGVDGLEYVVKTWPCGCFHEAGYHLGELEHLKLQLCTKCFETSLDALEQLTLDKRSQLTLPLA